MIDAPTTIEEACYVCDEPTGRAGKGEDSLYCEKCGCGPYCETCYDVHIGIHWDVETEPVAEEATDAR